MLATKGYFNAKGDVVAIVVEVCYYGIVLKEV